jgi:hypothetical protein
MKPQWLFVAFAVLLPMFPIVATAMDPEEQERRPVTNTTPAAPADVPEVRLASGGRAFQAVVIGENPAAEVRQAAEELADYLGRITGADFAVQTGDGSAGIVVGTAAGFQPTPVPDRFQDRPAGPRGLPATFHRQRTLHPRGGAQRE